MQEQYYAQLREDQNETRAMFHDINKYLRAMRALASEANTEEASQVFAEAQDLVQSLVSVVDVGNTVISVILNDYKAQAEEQNIIANEQKITTYQQNVFGTDGVLTKKQEELLKPFHEKVAKSISDYAVAQGYQMVIDIATTALPYYSPAIDITEQIIKIVNQ